MALVVSITYRLNLARSTQPGCLVDGMHTVRSLINHGTYKASEIVFLTDGSRRMIRSDPLFDNVRIERATRKKILYHLHELIASDHTDLWFSYSGHGYSSQGGLDESDTSTEYLVPSNDFFFNSIRDNTLASIARNVRKDQSLFILLDCCHSNTLFDLPYSYDTKTQKLSRENNNTFDGLITCISAARDDQRTTDNFNHTPGGSLSTLFRENIDRFSVSRIKKFSSLLYRELIRARKKGDDVENNTFTVSCSKKI